MATNNRIRNFGWLCLALLGHIALGAPIRPADWWRNAALCRSLEARILPLTEQEVRERWLATARAQVGVLERGYNRHDSIQTYNRWARVPPYSPYCAAGLGYTAAQAGLFFPITGPAAVRSWFVNTSLVVWDRRTNRWRNEPMLMDVVWIFNSHLEAIAQPRIKRDIEEDDKIITIGFNTTGNTGRAGVHHPIQRRWRDVKRVANHVSPHLQRIKK